MCIRDRHLAIDPILIASHLVIALQNVVSRNANPTLPSVLSIGKFIANGATNIIPDEVHLEGTFRTFDEKWRANQEKHPSDGCSLSRQGNSAKFYG